MSEEKAVLIKKNRAPQARSGGAGLEERVLYEDNHLIIINKLPGEIVQKDKSGDRCLADDVKLYLKEKYNKPGNVYLGIPHRLDRPTSGIVIFCRTEKALIRMNDLFRKGDVDKVYWAVTDRGLDREEGRLVHYIIRNSEKNKSFAYISPRQGAQEARLEYTELARSERYTLLQIRLLTGRHHQIRAQLAACGVHIKGDLKYGFPRSNADGGICLHSRKCSFIHPVSGEKIEVSAPVPSSCDPVWGYFRV
ncbi:MAG: RluA family pseudouridine synthase [Sphaerochaetaceae bacterium]|nr:RluA family pseudouridine synthase [Sphaerochaetaceae bacterium]